MKLYHQKVSRKFNGYGLATNMCFSFLTTGTYVMIPNQSSNHARNLRELCIWTTIVNGIWTCICCSHVIIFVFYCLVRAGRVIVVECTGSDSQSQSICTASICRSHVIIFVFYCLVPCHEFPDQVPVIG